MKLTWIHRTILLMRCVIFLDNLDSCILLMLMSMGMRSYKVYGAISATLLLHDIAHHL